MMTIADIEAGIKLLSIEEKQRVLELLLSDLAGDDEELKTKLTQEALDDVTAGSLRTKTSKPGLTAWEPITRFRYRADANSMDQQSALRPAQAPRIFGPQ